jgi:hypothetical protein
VFLIPNAAPVREYNTHHDTRGRFGTGAGGGVPALKARSKMPQLGGHTPTGQLVAHFNAHGIKTTRGKVQASTLTPTQHQMVPATVRGMADNKAFEPGRKPIFVSKDGHIVDGHHRVAAVALRAKRGTGNGLMSIIRVHAPIAKVLTIAHAFAKRQGIARKAA